MRADMECPPVSRSWVFDETDVAPGLSQVLCGHVSGFFVGLLVTFLYVFILLMLY